MFSALVLDKSNGEVQARVRQLETDDLPDPAGAGVQIDILYSSLNYKDALAVTGRGQIIRGDYPIVPGIDLVGEVTESAHESFSAGDHVIGTGWQLGEVVWGGYSQRAKVDGDKLVALPDGLSPEQAMTSGTAGFTAMLSVMALDEHGVTSEMGDVLVTGASGGAGSFAVALLDALDYKVVASTGSEDAHDYLYSLGADRIVDRGEFQGGPTRPMESGTWAGAVDAVGGETLSSVISQLERHGSVAVFGNVAGHELHTSVLPFILRGINLLGIDSNTCPNDRRRSAWQGIAQLLDESHFDRIRARTISLEEITRASQDLLAGDVRGRLLVRVSDE